MLKIIIALCLLAGASVNAQRVVPGVNPQHYQQPVQHQQQHPQHPPQYQQQQVHPNHLPPGVNPQQYQQQVQYQQVPVQQQQQVHMQQPVQQVPVQQVPVQQVPVQQQQVPVQHQQVPQGHGGHHANHGQVLNAANIQHEKEHIQEHLHVPIDTSKMSEAELQFHYFKMHDSDNNNKLDGCELIKSLIHWHEQGSKEGHDGQQPHVEEKIFTDEELVALIDPILQMDDSSKDGYIDYPEFMRAQQKSQQQQQQQQQQQAQSGGH
ncbi:putative mediator of RNA polymerase II transcription subunit 12 [Musca vetustissima]|uniref:putative mediator of RNA polymerase II transcription subunit 12 n=1 Tax=Musca vetustissima TaxID=27455 RepID=UPI002AB7B42B|nr:putative mediator of RNA polymerase II transcription subunit 12 [Musca vetustissima]